MVDDAPLTSPPKLAAGPAPPVEGGGGWLTAALLALSAGVVLLARPQQPEARA